MSNVGRFFLVFLLSVLPVTTARAQVVSGSVHGWVRDASQAVVPAADVTARNLETGLIRQTFTDDYGFYEFPSLPPGRYMIAAELAGFKRYEQTELELTVGQRLRVDAQLEIGEITEAVTVTGGSTMVDSRGAEISALVDDQRITDLPLNGRNVVALAGLLPGVSTVYAPQVQYGLRGGPLLTVHGSRANSNYLTLDGAYFNNPSRNTGMNPPPPDALREFRIKTNNFSASEGRNSGAIVSFVTRSGTNDFHGAVWEFHRNDNLNARSFFEAERPDRIMNQFGVAAGGPIVKDRIHVFGSYEGFRDRPQAAVTNAYPPTERERAGDFSHVSEQLFNPYTGEPFPDNQVPTSLFDPVSLNLLKSIPLPNQPDGRLVTNDPQLNNNDLAIFRNDIRLSERQDLFWHYYYNKNVTPSYLRGNIPGWQYGAGGSRFHSFGLTHNFVVSPAFLNSFTFGLGPGSMQRGSTVERSTQELGMDFPNYTPTGPGFRVPGRFNLAAFYTADLDFEQEAFNFHESTSWIKGPHTMKFGVEFFRLEFLQSWTPVVRFDFGGGRSADPEDTEAWGDVVLDFLLGAWRFSSVSYYPGVTTDSIQPWYWSFYFQDEWRVSPRLTLTLGLRYELPSPWNDTQDLALSSIALPWDACREDPTRLGPTVDLKACGAKQTKAPFPDAPPGYLFANYDLPRGLVRTDRNNLAPRLGFAYDLSGDGRTSLRGGGGVFYDTANADTLAVSNPPFTNRYDYDFGQLSAPNAGITEFLPPVDFRPEDGQFPLPLTALSTDQSIRNTYTFHWNLGVQHQLMPDLMISVDYVGKIGRKLMSFYPFNPAVYIPGTDADGNPLSTVDNADDRVLYGRGTYGAYYNLMLGSMYDAWYHGLDVEVNKRLSDGFSLLTAFTWSKAIDQQSDYAMGGWTSNPFNIKKSDQGLAWFDRRIVLSTSALWEPYSGEEDWLSGWMLAPTFRTTTGAPLEFWTTADLALDGLDGDMYGSQHLVALRNPRKEHPSKDSKVTEWFDTTALVLPEVGTYGNAARGLVAGPGFFTFDLGVLKDFSLGITEDSRLQFRAEFFNLFNNTNLGSPGTVPDWYGFGQIMDAGPGREIQFGLKFLW